jgi:hypothetical protein
VVGLLAATQVVEGVHRCGFASEAFLTCCVFYIVVLHLISGHWANTNQWVFEVGAYLHRERPVISISKIRIIL